MKDVLNCHQRQGFLLCWYSVIRQPVPKLRDGLIKGNKDDIIFRCPAIFVQPGLQLTSDGR